MIKCVVCDLDGTLFLDGNPNDVLDLSEKAEKAITLMKLNGMKLIIATGRPMKTPFFLVDKYWHKDTIICVQNGACVFDGKDIKINKMLEKKEVYEIINTIKSSSSDYVYYDVGHVNGDRIYEVIDSARHINPIKNLTYIKQYEGIDKHIDMYKYYGKVLVDAVNQKNAEALCEEIISKIGDKYEVKTSSRPIVEITSKGATKAIVIDYLTNQLGYGLDEIAVCGDSFNDRAMLEMVKYSYCMKSGNSKLFPLCYKSVSDVLEAVEDIIYLNDKME